MQAAFLHVNIIIGMYKGREMSNTTLDRGSGYIG